MNDIQKCELEILKEVDRICRKHNLTYFLSSGTLLGAIRHGGFIPWDDDIDIIMGIKDYRKFLSICKKELSDRFFLQCTQTDRWMKYSAKVRMNNTTMIEAYFEKADIHQGVWIDIFPLVRVPKDPKKLRRINKMISVSNYFVMDSELDINTDILPVFKLLLKLPLSLRRLCAGLLRRMAFKPVKDSGWCDYYWGYPIEKARFTPDFFNEVELVTFEDGQFMAPKDYHRLLSTVYGDYMTPPPEDRRNSGHNIIFVDLNHSYTNYVRQGQPLDLSSVK